MNWNDLTLLLGSMMIELKLNAEQASYFSAWSQVNILLDNNNVYIKKHAQTFIQFTLSYIFLISLLRLFEKLYHFIGSLTLMGITNVSISILNS